MLFGHVGNTLLPSTVSKWLGLSPDIRSFNSPLWTLHLEFYGSLLVLLLVYLETRIGRIGHRCLFIALLISLIAHPLDLFLIGYCAAKLLGGRAWAQLKARWWLQILAVFGIIVGIAMSAHLAPIKVMKDFSRFSDFTHLPMRLDFFLAFDQYAGILIFFGILALPYLQRLLTTRIARTLGRYSFSLYLVHFPILFTVTSAVVVWTHNFHHGRTALAVLTGWTFTVIMTIVFERYVDKPATMLSRKAGRWLSKPA